MASRSESLRSRERRTVGLLDRAAIGLSALCVVHCIATVLLAATLASLGAALARPAWHELGFAAAMLLGALALGRGYALHRDWRPLLLGGFGLTLMGAGLLGAHGWREIGLTVAGVLLLSGAHWRNAQAGPHRHAFRETHG